MTRFQTSPPPKQKPTTPIAPVDCDLRNASVALWSESLSAVERFASSALYAALSASLTAPPARAARSMLIPTKPAVATRRTTSLMCSSWPRFSWMTMTPGTRALPAGRAM